MSPYKTEQATILDDENAWPGFHLTFINSTSQLMQQNTITLLTWESQPTL
jgi:hypothetical protein